MITPLIHILCTKQVVLVDFCFVVDCGILLFPHVIYVGPVYVVGEVVVRCILPKKKHLRA